MCVKDAERAEFFSYRLRKSYKMKYKKVSLLTRNIFQNKKVNMEIKKLFLT